MPERMGMMNIFGAFVEYASNGFYAKNRSF